MNTGGWKLSRRGDRDHHHDHGAGAEGAGGGELSALSQEAPVLLAYVLSFINVGSTGTTTIICSCDRADRRASALGEPVPAVLAEPGALRHSLA